MILGRVKSIFKGNIRSMRGTCNINTLICTRLSYLPPLNAGHQVRGYLSRRSIRRRNGGDPFEPFLPECPSLL
ncbi:hypothetical protein BDV38DRAFT_243138 [Aspergillus pseudotamarii]|uniref:Uncharacterized protein n=1 Tax=Aspergillus pseudotamarii TaxID=132259 RepID=A0A5N6T0F2_ASPPS|nr:uncharacterized protein BDV38DRAFT_243138 [Aspergillus pseudotamarii]KAE8139263.1 hypothetical protein BDV38DRAFT_243138 [Aspergillus pseudotamarii]